MQQNAKSFLVTETGIRDDKCDPSILQKPLNLGVKNIHQILRCIQNGSTEVKDIILNECNVIYECKICRNLFRSLPNLLSHKRFYCKEHCCESMLLFADIERDESTIIVQPESPPDDEDGYVPDNFVENETVNNEIVNGDSNSNASVEDSKIKEINVIGNTSPKIFVPSGKRPRKAEPQKLTINDDNIDGKLNNKPNSNKIKKELIIEPIRGNNNAVFQRLNDRGTRSAKVIRNIQKSGPQNEKAMTGKKIIVIIPKHTTSAKAEQSKEKQTSPFSSRRKALASRNDCDVDTLSCLKCSTTYMSLKTLYLHMMNLHAKRRLYYPCPFCKTSYVQIWGVSRHLMTVHKKSKDQAVKLRSVIKKRAFLKPFDKNATGESKSQGNSPQNSSNRTQYTKPSVTSSSSVQIHKCSKCNRIFTRKTSRISHEKFCGRKNKAPLTSHSQKKNESNVRPKRIAEKKLNRDFINSQTLKWRSANKVDTSCIKAPPKKESENNLGSKLMTIINPSKLSCTKCHKRFSSFPNLKRHAAIHLGWTRFKCKHCSFQSYQKSQCRAHIERAHKGLSNPENIEKLIINLETDKDKTANNEKPSTGQTSNNITKSGAQSAKAVCKDKDSQKNRQGKSSPCQSSSSSPELKKPSGSSYMKTNADSNRKSNNFDSDNEGKLSTPISASPSSAVGVRQITTRLSMRTLEEEANNFTKFYSTLVTRSTSYPKLDLLMNRQTSSSAKEKTESELGVSDKRVKVENHCRIDGVLKAEKPSKHQNCVPPIIIKCNPHVSELP